MTTSSHQIPFIPQKLCGSNQVSSSSTLPSVHYGRWLALFTMAYSTAVPLTPYYSHSWERFCVSYPLQNHPDQPWVGTLCEFLQEGVIIIGVLLSIVFTPPNYQYVGGFILLLRPLPTYEQLVTAVLAASNDTQCLSLLWIYWDTINYGQTTPNCVRQQC